MCVDTRQENISFEELTSDANIDVPIIICPKRHPPGRPSDASMSDSARRRHRTYNPLASSPWPPRAGYRLPERGRVIYVLRPARADGQLGNHEQIPNHLSLTVLSLPTILPCPSR